MSGRNQTSGGGRALSRRAVLQGAGVALALPWLDAMTPAFARSAEPALPRRMLAIQTNMGLLPDKFFPTTAGPGFVDTPYLALLKAHRGKYTVFTGVSHPDVDGAHEAERSFLSAAPHPGGAGFKNTISLDQFAAERLGPVTRFPTLTLAVNAEATQGMAYSRSGVRIPPEKSPAALYRQLFLQGDAKQQVERIADLRAGRSLLDFVGDNARRLQRAVGPRDRDRLDQYATAVRELEDQLLQAEAWERRPKPRPAAPEPRDPAEPRQLCQRIATFLDMLTLAFETDSTRIATLFVNTFSVVPDVPGVSQETHSLTHHGNRPEALDQLFRIESAQLRVLDRFLSGLAARREAGAPLLDGVMTLYGAPMGSANSHANTNLPILLAGGGFRHVGHLAFDKSRNYPLPRLFVSMLQRMGVAVDRFASSAGTMRGFEPA